MRQRTLMSSFLTIKIYIEIKTYSFVSCIVDPKPLTQRDDVILRISIKDNNVNNHDLFVSVTSHLVFMQTFSSTALFNKRTGM